MVCNFNSDWAAGSWQRLESICDRRCRQVDGARAPGEAFFSARSRAATRALAGVDRSRLRGWQGRPEKFAVPLVDMPANADRMPDPWWGRSLQGKRLHSRRPQGAADVPGTVL